MKALRLENIGKLELVELPVPEISNDELLIQTGAAVICTSDLNDIRSNPFGLKLPVVPGHEGAGIVAKIGRNVRGFAKGDRVAAHPVHPCGDCTNCRRGLGHLCSAMKHLGINMQGVFAEFFVLRADRARKVPAAIPFATAALAEPICVCIEALEMAQLDRGATLLIMGDGPFGILLVRLAQALPHAKTVIAGRHDFRLKFANGAIQINLHKVADARTRLIAEAGSQGYDAAILAVSSAQAAQESLALLRARGRLVIFSAVPAAVPLDLFSVHLKELSIVGACNDAEKLDEALRVIADRKIPLDDLITHRFELKDYRQAFALAEKGREEAIKVAFEFGIK